MNTSNISLQPMPKTMEQLIAELFNPPEKKPFFVGYKPQFHFEGMNKK